VGVEGCRNRGVARGLGQYLGYTKRGKTRRLAKRVSGGRKNDKTFTECGFSELRRGGDDQKIRAERKSALLIRKLRLAILLLASPVFAQDKAAVAKATAACGPADVQFDVSTDKNQHPAAKPDDGIGLRC